MILPYRILSLLCIFKNAIDQEMMMTNDVKMMREKVEVKVEQNAKGGKKNDLNRVNLV